MVQVDARYLGQVQQDARKQRKYGIVFLILGILSQFLYKVQVQVQGFVFMVIIIGIILIGSGILFIGSSYSVPKTRWELIKRYQDLMVNTNPDRRLYAAQRLVGYAKDAEFSKKEILALAQHATKIAKEPPVPDKFALFVTVDHIIFLREIAVNVTIDKHTRKEFVQILQPLQKLNNLPDEAHEMLADALAYHPGKLAVHAYQDLKKQQTEYLKEPKS